MSDAEWQPGFDRESRSLGSVPARALRVQHDPPHGSRAGRIGRKNEEAGFRDNPRRLGKGWARLVGATPLKDLSKGR